MKPILENEVRYAVKVNGKVVTKPFTTQALAEHALYNLPKDQQLVALIVPVTESGRELLLG